jgi:hypothetical protein
MTAMKKWDVVLLLLVLAVFVGSCGLFTINPRTSEPPAEQLLAINTADDDTAAQRGRILGYTVMQEYPSLIFTFIPRYENGDRGDENCPDEVKVETVAQTEPGKDEKDKVVSTSIKPEQELESLKVQLRAIEVAINQQESEIANLNNSGVNVQDTASQEPLLQRPQATKQAAQTAAAEAFSAVGFHEYVSEQHGFTVKFPANVEKTDYGTLTYYTAEIAGEGAYNIFVEMYGESLKAEGAVEAALGGYLQQKLDLFGDKVDIKNSGPVDFLGHKGLSYEYVVASDNTNVCFKGVYFVRDNLGYALSVVCTEENKSLAYAKYGYLVDSFLLHETLTEGSQDPDNEEPGGDDGDEPDKSDKSNDPRRKPAVASR